MKKMLFRVSTLLMLVAVLAAGACKSSVNQTFTATAGTYSQPVTYAPSTFSVTQAVPAPTPTFVLPQPTIIIGAAPPVTVVPAPYPGGSFSQSPSIGLAVGGAKASTTSAQYSEQLSASAYGRHIRGAFLRLLFRHGGNGTQQQAVLPVIQLCRYQRPSVAPD